MDNSTGEEKGATNGISAQKDAVLTIESGTHENIRSSSATIVINGGTFDGMMNFGNKVNPATVTINGGTFNSDVSATYGTWRINGGIFNGPVYASVSKEYEYATCHILGGSFKTDPTDCMNENSGMVTEADGYFVVSE